jgi:type IV secretory pathway component VirB8
MGKFVITAVVAVGMLCACTPAKTQDYYVAHPDEMKADLAACKAAGKNTYDCNEAAKAELIVTRRGE